MQSNKKGIAHLVEICAQKGIETVVLSPGSRNAPLTISFDEHPQIECLSIPDERCAAFFALGIALQTGKTVAICCTSGSAALNYAPAIAEAFYQKIPLLILTADRPVEWVDQGDGQTIRQRGVYANFIRGSFELPQEAQSKDDLWYNDRLINEAIDLTQHPTPGPVHVNLPLKENLYGQADTPVHPKITETLKWKPELEPDAWERLIAKWNALDKKLVLCGQMKPNDRLNRMLNDLSNDPSVLVLTETTANQYGQRFCGNIDRLISEFTDEEESAFTPNLLVTIGDAIISKKIKQLFRKNRPDHHWHIDPSERFQDTYQALTSNIPLTPTAFFQPVLDGAKRGTGNYGTKWKGVDYLRQSKHQLYLEKCLFSDLKVYDSVLAYLPPNSLLHMANSTAVRYVQLFDQIQGIHYYANRGTSGIDGSTSTAAGMALKTEKITTLITGDMSFFYDSNAFWNQHLTSNLRVILINNGGGNIFRIIPGPDSTNQLETYFETKHSFEAEHICAAFNINYARVNDWNGLENELNDFFLPAKNQRPKVLEVITRDCPNDTVLKNYFS